MDVAEQLLHANSYRTQVGVLVSGEYSDEPKNVLLLAYTDVVIEHHKSITLLIAQMLYGSAFALVRIQYEAFMRAHWVIGCATAQQVEALVTEEFEFPRMERLVSECDTVFQTDGFFQIIKTQAWRAMNSYTHSGIRQLTRRFSSGNVEPNYNNTEIKEVLNATKMTVLLVGRLLCAVVGKQAETDEIGRLIYEFSCEQPDTSETSSA